MLYLLLLCNIISSEEYDIPLESDSDVEVDKPQANEVEDSHEPNAQLSQVSENLNSGEQEYYSNEYGEQNCYEKSGSLENPNPIVKQIQELEYKISNRMAEMEARMNNRIDELADNMNNKIDELADNMNKMEDRMNNRMDKMEDRMDKMESRMSDQMDEMKISINNLTSRMDNVENSILDLYDLHHGNRPKDSSYKSTGIIKVFPGSNEGNQYASGNLVSINSKYYFSTCRHVVMTSDYRIRNIRFIQLLNNVSLEIEGPIYIFRNTSIPYDYALIEVKYDPCLEGRSARISNDSATLSEIVRGVCYRDVNLVYIEGKVVELDQNDPNSYQTDCGGTHGFSGAGYFDEHGDLKVIHRGGGYFLGEESEDIYYHQEYFKKSNTPLITSIKTAFEACNQTNRQESICYNAISNALNTHARNPRTMVLGANKFYELLDNNFAEIIVVKQNMRLKSYYNKLYSPEEL